MSEISDRRGFMVGVAAATAAMSTGASGQQAASSPPPRYIEGSPYPTFSRAVVFGGVAHIAGVVGQRPGTRDIVSDDFEPQARQTLENLKASIEAAGSSMDRVLKCTVFLTDAADFTTFNRVYLEFFTTTKPARSTVVVKELVVPGAKLEVDAVAAV